MPDLPKPARVESGPALPFERPIFELERKIAELRAIPDVSLNGELKPLEKKRDRLIEEVYGRLTPWEKVHVARAGANSGRGINQGHGVNARRNLRSGIQQSRQPCHRQPTARGKDRGGQPQSPPIRPRPDQRRPGRARPQTLGVMG